MHTKWKLFINVYYLVSFGVVSNLNDICPSLRFLRKTPSHVQWSQVHVSHVSPPLEIDKTRTCLRTECNVSISIHIMLLLFFGMMHLLAWTQPQLTTFSARKCMKDLIRSEPVKLFWCKFATPPRHWPWILYAPWGIWYDWSSKWLHLQSWNPWPDSIP